MRSSRVGLTNRQQRKQTRSTSKRTAASHSAALEKIAASPQHFGISNVKSVVVEPALSVNGHVVGKPEIVIETLDGALHIISYKNNRRDGRPRIAREQLGVAAGWYTKYRPDIDPKKIYVHAIFGSDVQHGGFFA